MMPRSVLTVLAVALAAATALAVFSLQQPSRDADLARLGTVTPLLRPRPLADFELVDQRGDAFTPDDFHGRWSLLFTGFTHCPDVCPTTLAQLARLEQKLPADAGERLQTVFLTVDPQRDTPQRLAEYVGYFGSRARGVTGAKAQIDAVTESLGMVYLHVPRGAGRYTVDHSAAVALIDPQARLVGYIAPPFAIDPLQRDLTALLEASR